MSPRLKYLPSVLALVAAVAFGFGLLKLFALRFEEGDVYADYSTLNTSPRGTGALFESFSRLGTLSVERNFFPLTRFRSTTGTTLVFPGAGRAFFGEDTAANFAAFEKIMATGTHVMVALDARSLQASLSQKATTNPWDNWSRASTDEATLSSEPKEASSENPTKTSPKENADEAEEKEEEETLTAGERWGFAFTSIAQNEKDVPAVGYAISLPTDFDPATTPVLVRSEADFPRWFSSWRWANLAPEWRVLAVESGTPVIIQRPFGAGSLTLLTDTTFLSNEALWRSPRPSFLLGLLGAYPRLVFDETLLGTRSDPGIMHLVRQYRLLGFLAGAAIVVALFAWRASTSLIPPHPSVEGGHSRPLVGAAGAEGLVTLLQQSLPANKVLRTCFTEWARSPFLRRRYSDATVTALRDEVLAAKDPIVGYRAIRERLAAARRS